MPTDMSTNTPSGLKHATHPATSLTSAIAYAWRMNSSLVMSFLSARIGSCDLDLARTGLRGVDRLGDPLGDHEDRGVQRHRRNAGDDRGVDHAHPVEALDGAARVDDRPWVLRTAHRRRRGRVPVGREV